MAESMPLLAGVVTPEQEGVEKTPLHALNLALVEKRQRAIQFSAYALLLASCLGVSGDHVGQSALYLKGAFEPCVPLGLLS